MRTKLLLIAIILSNYMAAQTIDIPVGSTDSIVRINVSKIARTIVIPPTLPIDTSIAPTTIKGFGYMTTGGNGFDTVFVTNLNSSGKGSLFDAIKNNRIISFRKLKNGGIIIFRGEFTGLRNVTIDASDSPLPGITLNNNNNGTTLSFDNCSNIIVKNVRSRNAGEDGMNIIGGENIAILNCSVSNYGDGGIDITQGAKNVTIQNVIFGEGRSTGNNGACLIAYPPTKNISIINCVFVATNIARGERQPLVHNAVNGKSSPVDYLMCDLSNCIIYQWGRGKDNLQFGYGAGVDYGATIQLRSNYFYSAAQPANLFERDHDTGDGKSQYYADGNVSGNGIAIKPGNLTPWPVPASQLLDACTAARAVLNTAGARPLDIDDAKSLAKISFPGCK